MQRNKLVMISDLTKKGKTIKDYRKTEDVHEPEEAKVS